MFKKVFPAQIVSIFFTALFFLASCGEQKDPLINKANEEWIQGHNHSALEMLNEVLKNNPSGPIAEEALFRMGEIHHFSLNNSTRALVFFQEVRQMNPYETLANIYVPFYESILPFTHIYGEYDFYTDLTTFVAGLYAADQIELARELSGHISQQYIDLLNRFLSIDKEQLSYYEMDIGIEIEAYKSLVSTIKRNEIDQEFIEKVQKTYKETVGQFSFLD